MAIGSVQFGGLASGLPPDLVDQLMEGKQARLKAYERDKNWFTDQKASYGELQAKLTALSSKAVALQDVSSWAPHTTSSSDADKISATATNAATAATHTLYVGQLATNDTYVMDSDVGLSSSTETLATASALSFNYNGTAYSIADTSGLTLSDLASQINGLDYGNDAGVSASVLYDGSAYRLVIGAKDSGMNSGAARLDSISLTNGGVDQGFTNTVAAQDAIFNIAGVSATSTSNSVSDVLTGVTLELKSVTTGTEIVDGAVDSDNLGTGVSVSISDDTGQLKSTLTSFVDAYNAVVDYVSANKNGSLSGSTTARSIVSQLRSVLNTRTHKDDASGSNLSPFSTLAELGLRTDQKTGRISFNGTSLDEAIKSDFTGITSLFTNTQSSVGTGNNAGIAHRFEDLIKGITNSSNGTLTNQDSGLQSRIDRLGKDIERENKRLEKVRQQLTLKFSNLEQMVSKLNSAGAAMTSALSQLSS